MTRRLRCALFLLALWWDPAGAQTPAQLVCLECHGERDLQTQRGGEVVSLFVDAETFGKSVHGGLECNDCHLDVDPENLPHPERLQPVHWIMRNRAVRNALNPEQSRSRGAVKT